MKRLSLQFNTVKLKHRRILILRFNTVKQRRRRGTNLKSEEHTTSVKPINPTPTYETNHNTIEIAGKLGHTEVWLKKEVCQYSIDGNIPRVVMVNLPMRTMMCTVIIFSSGEAAAATAPVLAGSGLFGFLLHLWRLFSSNTDDLQPVFLFSGELRPPPTTSAMVTGGGGRVYCIKDCGLLEFGWRLDVFFCLHIFDSLGAGEFSGKFLPPPATVTRHEHFEDPIRSDPDPDPNRFHDVTLRSDPAKIRTGFE
ncbi:hypothetical protein LXL04_015602 [Taraxacum kok-saghyz]